SLAQLVDNFGNPPPDSKGLHLAVQSLMYERDIIFYRVREEGFSVQDYFKGLQNLQLALGQVSLVAIALPGVGDEEVIDYSMHICHQIKSVLITTEADLYDYLTVFDRRGKD
ncbi:MAG: hypothetical protein KDK78_05485, partial [Chlamydiia bacterium]|nr:hypothetical protein [Chlamydiia bacterium]